jgi:hypothetical protein
MTTPDWTLEHKSIGPAGYLYYKEGLNTIEFYYEFGGGKVVAILYPPDKQAWDEKFPWAAGRRQEIVERTAQEAIRQYMSGCIAKEDKKKNWIEIRRKR